MKKIFDKKTIITVIICGIVFTGIGICAANYNASDITYTKDGAETNVNEALNELYDISNKVNITHLGTTSGGIFDCTGIEGYENLTSDNFLLVLTSIPMNRSRIEKTVWNATAHIDEYSLNKAYNASTGKLTYTSVLSFLVSVQNGEGYHNANNSTILTFDVYLIA